MEKLKRKMPNTKNKMMEHNSIRALNRPYISKKNYAGKRILRVELAAGTKMSSKIIVQFSHSSLIFYAHFLSNLFISLKKYSINLFVQLNPNALCFSLFLFGFSQTAGIGKTIGAIVVMG